MEARPVGLWLQQAASRVARIASVCTGAFVLARAGLLDGRRVVTHWVACEHLQAEFSSLKVEQNAIYFRDGACWTSAGITAGIDMALAMVEADLGTEVAMSVAKRLVVFYKRPGGQSQFSSELLAQSVADERIAVLHEWIKENLRKQLTVQTLAERLAMTSRTFARYYVERTGTTPARAIEKLRLERACDLIESRHISIKAVALQCGFSSEEVMRRSFMRRLHVGPADYKKRFSSSQSY
jgi:transcriptional regulator GlxA family with amidase domain